MNKRAIHKIHKLKKTFKRNVQQDTYLEEDSEEERMMTPWSFDNLIQLRRRQLFASHNQYILEGKYTMNTSHASDVA